MTASSHPLDKNPKARKKSEPVFVDGKGVPIVDHRSNAPENAHYELIPHVCTICLGRLLRRYLGGGRRKKYEYRCACCGDSHVLYEDDPIPCWCGKTAGTHGKIFECVPNTSRRTELPNEILVKERPHELKPTERMYRPVFSESQDYL